MGGSVILCWVLKNDFSLYPMLHCLKTVRDQNCSGKASVLGAKPKVILANSEASEDVSGYCGDVFFTLDSLLMSLMHIDAVQNQD